MIRVQTTLGIAAKAGKLGQKGPILCSKVELERALRSNLYGPHGHRFPFELATEADLLAALATARISYTILAGSAEPLPKPKPGVTY